MDLHPMVHLQMEHSRDHPHLVHRHQDHHLLDHRQHLLDNANSNANGKII
ncbi:hypothetical protein CBL_02301 [Carabus blaptoides fortunei]